MSIPISTGSGAASVAAEAVAGLQYQQVEVLGKGGASTLAINPDGSFFASILGRPSISGSVGLVGTPSISGAVTVVGTPSISGAVTIVGNASVSGTVGASVIGTVPVTQAGPFVISGSILGYMAPLASLVSGVTSVITSTSITAVLASAPGGQRNYITNIIATNAAATGTFVDIRFGTTVVYSGFAGASGGGFVASFPTPLAQSSISAVVDMQTSAQASVKVAISGFTA